MKYLSVKRSLKNGKPQIREDNNQHLSVKNNFFSFDIGILFQKSAMPSKMMWSKATSIKKEWTKWQADKFNHVKSGNY